MVYCPSCGKIAEPGDKFCHSCGAALARPNPLAAPSPKTPAAAWAAIRATGAFSWKDWLKANRRLIAAGVLLIVIGLVVGAVSNALHNAPYPCPLALDQFGNPVPTCTPSQLSAADAQLASDLQLGYLLFAAAGIINLVGIGVLATSVIRYRKGMGAMPQGTIGGTQTAGITSVCPSCSKQFTHAKWQFGKREISCPNCNAQLVAIPDGRVWTAEGYRTSMEQYQTVVKRSSHMNKVIPIFLVLFVAGTALALSGFFTVGLVVVLIGAAIMVYAGVRTARVIITTTKG